MEKVRLIFVVLFLLTGVVIKSQPNNPLADNKAIVISDNVRFTVLTSQLIRMEWSDNGVFEDKASLVFINRNLKVPEFKVKDTKDNLTITTEHLKLIYKKTGKFTKDNLTISFQLNNKQQVWNPDMKDDKNLSGTARTLDGVSNETDIKLEEGLLSRNGWSLIDDSKSNLFDGSKDWNWVMPRSDNNRQDWYFFGYGHDYKKALKDYTIVAGKIPMPPRFAFGYWWSRYWDYSEEEFRTLVKGFKTNNIPIDVLIIDMEWHNTWGIGTANEKHDKYGERVGWTGYTWNRNLFSDPERFLQWTDKMELKTALNLHPASGIAPFEDCYDRFAKAYGFDTTGHNYIPFKIEDKKWAQTYFNEVLYPMEKTGVDFWWLDWQTWLENTGVKGLSNTWWLNYTFFTDMERRGEKRPMLFHRWGGLGNHRYQIGFSGDASSKWETLDYETYFTPTASNVCYGYWSHDIGGHVGQDKDPELYLRWLQFGAFSPIIRTHCTKGGATERRIWMYPNQFDMMREAINNRYQLEPYIYQNARKAYDEGVSICRPMYYDYPEAEKAYTYKKQYFFGNDLIVAPVSNKADTSTGLATKEIWLPEGYWFEMHSGRLLKGDQVIKKGFALNEIPVYAKAGSIIPMNPTVKNLAYNSDTLILLFIPGKKDASLNYYEDDGTTSTYQKNEYCTTNIYKKTSNDSLIVINIDETKGSYKGMSVQKAYQLQLANCLPPQKVMVNNKEYKYSFDGGDATWNYDGKTLALIINIPLTDRKTKLEISIYSNSLMRNKENILDGKKELFSRLPKIAEDFKTESCNMNNAPNPPESFLYAAGLACNITNYPFEILNLLNKYEETKSNMIDEIVNFGTVTDDKLNYWFNYLGFVNDFLPQPQLTYKKEKDNSATYSIKHTDPNVIIHYTTNGTKPDANSAIYKAPFNIISSSTVRAIATKKGSMNSLITNSVFINNLVKKCTYINPISPKYTGGSDSALYDGQMGNITNFRVNWLGIEKKDFIVQFELKRPLELKGLDTRFLFKANEWIILPDEIIVEASTDGLNYEIAGTLKPPATDNNTFDKIFAFTIPFRMAKTYSYIRFTAKTTGKLPQWHVFAGHDSWLFIDEIILK